MEKIKTTPINKEQPSTMWHDNKGKASNWFQSLRDQICAEFEAIEDELNEGPHKDMPAGRFKRSPWSRDETGEPNESGSILNGGGEMSLMNGRVFEKVGVNISTVHGTFSEDFAAKIPGGADSDGLEAQRAPPQTAHFVAAAPLIRVHAVHAQSGGPTAIAAAAPLAFAAKGSST